MIRSKSDKSVNVYIDAFFQIMELKRKWKFLVSCYMGPYFDEFMSKLFKAKIS